MFSGHPGLAANGPVPAPNVDAQKLVLAIKDQTQGTPAHMVYVIDIVSVRFGGYFTQEVRQQLQKYRYLQMLTLNDCAIVSLENFPILPALIRLDMVFNNIPGEHLQYLAHSRHLQTIMLGANQVKNINDLAALKGMKKLLQLDLLNNPVVKQPGYRNQVFTLFPSLSILDTLDKIGKDAYNNSTMMQAVSRIPDNLFDKSIPPPPAPLPVFAAVHHKQKKKLSNAIKRAGSLDSITHKSKVAATKKAQRGKGGKAKINVGVGKSRSSKAGLIFPVGRIKRKLKQTLVNTRVSVSGSIYLTAVVQYLTAELIQIAGNDARNDHKKRITPASIKRSLKSDQQLQKLLQNVTIRLAE